MPDGIYAHVFLRRLPGGEVLALRSTYYLGVRVDYDEGKQLFIGRCYGVTFDVNGKEMPNEHGWMMQPLPVRLEGDRVWVRYSPRRG